jgi:hypothetical protein
MILSFYYMCRQQSVQHSTVEFWSWMVRCVNFRGHSESPIASLQVVGIEKAERNLLPLLNNLLENRYDSRPCFLSCVAETTCTAK